MQKIIDVSVAFRIFLVIQNYIKDRVNNYKFWLSANDTLMGVKLPFQYRL